MYHPINQEILHHLQSIIPNLVGRTSFYLGDLAIDVRSSDSIGNLIQEWFGVWASSEGYQINVPDGTTQSFPDFFVGNENSLLEVKSFNANRSPAFDIANFEAYCSSLAENPERVFADYLIFSYRKEEDSSIHIEDIWLKKVWEITGHSSNFPLKCQVKYRDRENGVYSIDNIRPIVWYSDRNNVAQPFTDPLSFADALYDTQQIYRGYSNREVFRTNYARLYRH